MRLHPAITVFYTLASEQWETWRKGCRSTPLLARLYIGSVVFDPFLFFVLADRLTVGFSLSLSRVFTVGFYAILAARSFRIYKDSSASVINNSYRLLMSFFVFIAASYIIGLLGGFDFISQLRSTENDAQTSFAKFVALPESRSIIEFIVFFATIFHYFWVGPRIINNEERYRALCSAFILLSIISVVVGVVNLFFAMYLGFNILPRHLAEFFYESPSFSGARFQGLAGEPRDAFGQIILFLTIVYFLIKSGYVRSVSLYFRPLFLLCLLFMAMTVSASGIIAIAIFVGLWVAHKNLRIFTVRNAFAFAAVIGFVVAILYTAINYIERFEQYYKAFSSILDLFESPDSLPPLVLTQANNFYPLIVWFNSCMSNNFFVCINGGGFGSSFALNSQIYSEGLNNPHSLVSRLLPETGIIGFSLYCMALLWPCFRALSNLFRTKAGLGNSEAKNIKVFLLALLASGLAHKSNNVYVGLLIVGLGLSFWQTKKGANCLTASERA
jgi:hypothetical protein